ncbi:terminase small subunit [Salmonella enterica]|nr:terminase small subunit [Salmonella enterica]
MALTDKQEMFCHEYLIDLNVTQAAIWAEISKIAITLPKKKCQNLTSSQGLLFCKLKAMIWLV